MATASDSFDRANENPLAGNWTTITGVGAMRIVSNTARSVTEARSGAYYNAQTFTNDHFSECVVGADGSSNIIGAGVAIRVSSSAQTCYYIYTRLSTTPGVTLFRCVSGTYDLIGQDNSIISPGATIRLSAVGSTISVTHNGDVRISVTDIDIPTGQYAGIWSYNTTRIIDFGTVRPGTTLYVPFSTYDSNDPTASVTMTGLAVTDIEIYKDGGTTQRASDAGYTLLDTDGIDFDGVTGIHGFSVDLANNTTAGFYAAGSQYWIVVSSITVDAGTINFIAATFRIGIPDAVLNTTIATLASQTSFTLTAGPAEDDALNGCVVYIHDVASAVQGGWAVVSDYTGSSKTVTLTAGTTYTVAAKI